MRTCRMRIRDQRLQLLQALRLRQHARPALVRAGPVHEQVLLLFVGLGRIGCVELLNKLWLQEHSRARTQRHSTCEFNIPVWYYCNADMSPRRSPCRVRISFASSLRVWQPQ